MDILKRFTVENFYDAEKGELLKIRNSGASFLAFAVELMPKGMQLLALESVKGRFKAPTLMTLPTAQVMSYGTDWVIEPIDDAETYAGNKKFAEIAGVLLLGDRSDRMQLREFGDFDDYFDFDLDAWEAAKDMAQFAAPVTRWDLWTSSAERERPGAVPILSFAAELPARKA